MSHHHLICHLYPVAGNGVWRRTIDQLRHRADVFDGRRVLAVGTRTEGTRHELDTPDAVREYAGKWFHDVIEVPNDPSLRETATWGRLRGSVLPHAADADAVFYCHSKGASKAVSPGSMEHVWADLMFRVCLDHAVPLGTLLRAHPIAGPFKAVGTWFGKGRGAWFYAGTFFWLRAGALRKRAGVVPPPSWWGVEAWPGVAFAPKAAGCLLMGWDTSKSLYSPTDWSELVLPEYQRWLRQYPPDRPALPPPFPDAVPGWRLTPFGAEPTPSHGG